MANSRDFTGKNRKFTGTKGIVPPKGTTGQRVGSESGELRFNTTTELMEYYDGNQWKPIDAPPTISNITTSDSVGTSTVLNADGSTLFTITINGGNFSIGPTVKFIGSTGTEYSAGNVSRVSASQITCTTLITMGTTDDPYDVRVTNTSGLSATLDDAFSFNAAPVFVTASGQLGTVYNAQVISGSEFNASATDAEGNTITYSILSGSLPGSGLTLSSSTGLITGTLAGTPSLGNYPFVVQAATTEGTVNRQFSLQVVATPPVTADFLVIGGGGGGGTNGGGGGAGGYRNSYSTELSGGNGTSEASLSLTVGSVYTITVGGGGAGGPYPSQPLNPGIASSIAGSGISTISSVGGGSGACDPTQPTGSPGGSGGGGGYPTGAGGTGTANQGFNGGASVDGGNPYGGGGGSAEAGNTDANGHGGDGRSSSITGSSVQRAAGGGGGNQTPSAAGTGGDGGGAPGTSVNGTAPAATPDNRGSGGGGSGGGGGVSSSGSGGVVILRLPTNRYSNTTTGSPTVSTDGSDTILVFTGNGSYTA